MIAIAARPPGRARPFPAVRGICAAAALLAPALLMPPGRAAAQIHDAYVYPNSVSQGDTVTLYVTSDAATFDVSVYRTTTQSAPYATWTGLPGFVQAVPESAYAYGCRWASALEIAVGRDWPSGVYIVRVLHPLGWWRFGIFTVREDDPGSTSRILFQSSVNTWEAYNAWGGKSLYDYNSTNHRRSYSVSFQRPYDLYQGRGDFPRWEQKLVQWLEGQGYTLEFCTNADLDAFPELEENYDLFVSVGHDEYWSWTMRSTLESRVGRGENVAFFSGNTCWWQIRYSPDHDRIICYKSKAQDPLTGVADSLVTVNWHADPVFRPENSLTGVSFRHGGYVNAEGWYPASEGYGDYTVFRSGHWVYEGTGLADGEEFGWDDTIVGFEVDGALFYWGSGGPQVTGADGTPLTYKILGLSPASQGFGTMGCYTRDGATVFNAATTDWADALGEFPDPVVERITANVFEHLLAGAASVAEAPAGAAGSAAPPRLRVSPVPFRPAAGSAVIERTGEPPAREELSVWDATGRRVARLGSAGRALWDGRDASGAPAPPGVYFAALEGTPRAAAKILLCR